MKSFFKSKKILSIIVLSFQLSLQCSQFSLVWGARSSTSEAQAFLAKFPSSYLASLEERRGRGSLPTVDIPVALEPIPLTEGRKVYRGNQFPYQVKRLPRSNAGGKDANWDANAYDPNRFFQTWSRDLEPGYFSQPRNLREQNMIHFDSRNPIKRFVLFSRCVIRSFYIIRFEANDDPDDPLGHGLDPDPLCPQEPRLYLARATRFGEWFFGI